MTRAGTSRQTQQQQPPPAVVGPSSGVFDSNSGNEFFELHREAGNRALGDWLKARVNNSAFQETGTPVVQQRPQQQVIQRKPANNASDNPADSAAEQKTETGGVARSLIVEDDARVEAPFKSLAKKSNKEVRDAYQSYARAYFYHRIVTTIEDMAVDDVSDLFKRDLSIAGTRPLVCSGYAILGAHLLTLAGGKVTRFISAVRATNEHIRNDTIDSGHAVAEINRGGKKFFVSNDSIFDTEKDAFDVAWGNPAAPMHQASGPTNNASLEALKQKLAKKMEQLNKKP